MLLEKLIKYHIEQDEVFCAPTVWALRDYRETLSFLELLSELKNVRPFNGESWGRSRNVKCLLFSWHHWRPDVRSKSSASHLTNERPRWDLVTNENTRASHLWWCWRSPDQCLQSLILNSSFRGFLWKREFFILQFKVLSMVLRKSWFLELIFLNEFIMMIIFCWCTFRTNDDRWS